MKRLKKTSSGFDSQIDELAEKIVNEIQDKIIDGLYELGEQKILESPYNFNPDKISDELSNYISNDLNLESVKNAIKQVIKEEFDNLPNEFLYEYFEND